LYPARRTLTSVSVTAVSVCATATGLYHLHHLVHGSSYYSAQWRRLRTLAAVAWSVDSSHLTEGGVGTRYTALQFRVYRLQRLGRWSDADAVRALHAV